LAYSSTLKMVAIPYRETSIDFYRTTRIISLITTAVRTSNLKLGTYLRILPWKQVCRVLRYHSNLYDSQSSKSIPKFALQWAWKNDTLEHYNRYVSLTVWVRQSKTLTLQSGYFFTLFLYSLFCMCIVISNWAE
jgi:hypothetical protein